MKAENKKSFGQEAASIAITIVVATIFGLIQKQVRNKITDLTGK